MALRIAPIHDIEDLCAAVNDASRHVQKTYFTFLLVSIYIAIIIVSTTHEQLLRGSDVTPPFLSVGMPIVWFYFIFPYLFLPLHLNLMIQYYLLSQKIHEMNKIDPNTDKPGSGLLFHTSLFTQSMIGTFRDGTRKVFFEPLVYYSSAVLPILMLFFGLIKFLPYHSEPITWLHRVSISLDLIMVWFFWVKIIQEEGQLKIWWDDFWGRISPEKSKMGRSNRAAAAVNFFLSLLLILFSVLVTTIPGESQSIEPVSQYFEDNGHGSPAISTSTKRPSSKKSRPPKSSRRSSQSPAETKRKPSKKHVATRNWSRGLIFSAAIYATPIFIGQNSPSPIFGEPTFNKRI